MEDVKLEIDRVCAGMLVKRYKFNRENLRSNVDEDELAARRLDADVRGYAQFIAAAYSHDLHDESYEHPDGALQYAKLALFPRWLLKWFPVKMKRITMKAQALYPKIPVIENEPVIFRQSNVEKNFLQNWGKRGIKGQA